MAKITRVRYEKGVLRSFEELGLGEGGELTVVIKGRSFYEVVRGLEVEAGEDVDKVLSEVRSVARSSTAGVVLDTSIVAGSVLKPPSNPPHVYKREVGAHGKIHAVLETLEDQAHTVYFPGRVLGLGSYHALCPIFMRTSKLIIFKPSIQEHII